MCEFKNHLVKEEKAGNLKKGDRVWLTVFNFAGVLDADWEPYGKTPNQGRLFIGGEEFNMLSWEKVLVLEEQIYEFLEPNQTENPVEPTPASHPHLFPHFRDGYSDDSIPVAFHNNRYGKEKPD
jgi:hypothetical protein